MYIFRILTFLLLCSQFFFFSDHNFQDLYFQNAFTKISASEINNKETFENTDLFHSFEREKLTKHQHYQAFWIYIYVKIDLLSLAKNGIFFRNGKSFSSKILICKHIPNLLITKAIMIKKIDYLPKLHTLNMVCVTI